MADPYVLSYEAFSLPDDGVRVPITSGACRHSATRVRTTRHTARDGSIFWEKVLPLDSAFGVGVFLEATPQREHVALFVARASDPDSFSWEDFASDGGGIFTHEGGGQLKASFVAGPGPDHLESIEFLTDVTLRYADDVMSRDGFTHEIVVKKGSLFRVLP